jgi:5,10-methylenetetrahydromethanopterin reductase
MKLGLTIRAQDPDELQVLTKLADRRGFDFVGIADTQLLANEVYTSLGMLGDVTESVQLGPSVTNPVTREVAVSASGMCTLDKITDGRATLFLGSGDSAVRTLGKQPGGLKEMRTFMEDFRALSNGETVDTHGQEYEIRWLQDADEVDVPIFLAGGGPKTLELGGFAADGVLIGGGMTPDVVESSLEHIERGAEKAGRDPDSISKWVYGRGNIHHDRSVAIDGVKSNIAAHGFHTFGKGSLDDKHTPDEYREQLEEFTERYDSHAHGGTGGQNPNKLLLEETGLVDYFLERYGVAGTPEDCLEKLQRIERMDDIEGVLVTGILDDPVNFINRMGTDVIPEL